MFNTVRTGNYSQSAKAVTQASDQIFAASMNAKPDFTKIAKEAIKGRSLERRTAAEAEAKVAKAGLKAFTDVTRTKNDIESKEKIRDIKRPAKRMAGVVAGLGAISQAAITNKNLKEDKAERDALRADQQAIYDKMLENNRALRDESKELREKLEASINGTDTEPTETPPKTEGSEPTSSGSATPPASPGVSPDISAQQSAGPGALSRKQITSLALDAGFTPEQAATVYGIAGGESGFDPSNSTERSGLKARTGEDSVGLMQINWGYHKDKGWLQGLGINSREDLFDPAKNMKAAKYLFDGRGNFGDWTVYNKGIYKDYL